MVAPPHEQRVVVGAGVELHVEGWPSQLCDHPVGFVLVHGLASNAAMWRGVARRLKDLGHSAISVDQRGHGRSSKPAGGYDVSSFVSDLAELLGQVPLRRPAVAGQSFGGNVVLELAARHPELVGGIACVDGGWIELSEYFASWDACLAELAPPVFDGRSVEEIHELLSSRHADWPETAIEGFLANFEIRPGGMVAPWLARSRHLEILRSLWDHHPSKLYESVKVPVLLVPAMNPGQISVWEGAAEKAAGLLPRCRLEPMTGDHDLHAQQPVAVADLLHEWADSLC
ncbi:MAG TPA: alpha/beta hydrolase [Acidimicrobiales bacterium]|nr:alpha/beta hydrolase [Acidimicrobiales bacterium]